MQLVVIRQGLVLKMIGISLKVGRQQRPASSFENAWRSAREHVDYVVGGPDRHEAPIRIVSSRLQGTKSVFAHQGQEMKTIIKLNDVQAACPEGKENIAEMKEHH